MPDVSYRFGRFALDYGTRQLLLRRRRDPPLAESVRAADHPARQPAARSLESRAAGTTCGRRRSSRRPTSRVSLPRFGAPSRDSATRPVFLRTVYRFGYRFVGEVVESDAAPRTAPSRPEAVPRVREPTDACCWKAPTSSAARPDATIQCDAPGVSRHHARIVVSQGEATLEDLGSKNGTYLRSERITSARLSDGDEIRLGTVKLTFRINPILGETDTVLTGPAG